MNPSIIDGPRLSDTADAPFSRYSLGLTTPTSSPSNSASVRNFIRFFPRELRVPQRRTCGMFDEIRSKSMRNGKIEKTFCRLYSLFLFFFSLTNEQPPPTTTSKWLNKLDLPSVSIWVPLTPVWVSGKTTVSKLSPTIKVRAMVHGFVGSCNAFVPCLLCILPSLIWLTHGISFFHDTSLVSRSSLIALGSL